jgi:hypothetical protein
MFLSPALEVLAPVAWLALLIGKRVRAEFLPRAMVEIYVNLLNEGTPCARPTQALILGNGLFELLPTEGYDPDVEHWEFRPGSIVRGKETPGDEAPYLLATSFESRVSIEVIPGVLSSCSLNASTLLPPYLGLPGQKPCSPIPQKVLHLAGSAILWKYAPSAGR